MKKDYKIVSTNPNRWATTSIPLEDQPMKYDGWYWVEIPRSGLTKPTSDSLALPYIFSKRRENIHTWCHENCTKHWSEETILTYVFADEEDSVLFALTWI